MIQHRHDNWWVVCRTCQTRGPIIKSRFQTGQFDAIEEAERAGWQEASTPPIPGFVMYCPTCKFLNAPLDPDYEESSTFGDRYKKFHGAADGLPADLAEQHKHYLLGKDKKP